jgi:hypothetical protein
MRESASLTLDGRKRAGRLVTRYIYEQTRASAKKWIGIFSPAAESSGDEMKVIQHDAEKSLQFLELVPQLGRTAPSRRRKLHFFP